MADSDFKDKYEKLQLENKRLQANAEAMIVRHQSLSFKIPIGITTQQCVQVVDEIVRVTALNTSGMRNYVCEAVANNLRNIMNGKQQRGKFMIATAQLQDIYQNAGGEDAQATKKSRTEDAS